MTLYVALTIGVLPSGVVVASHSRHVADTVSTAVLAARKAQDVIDAGPPGPTAPPPAMPPSPACPTVTAESQLLYMAGRACIFTPLPPPPPPGPLQIQWWWGERGGTENRVRSGVAQKEEKGGEEHKGGVGMEGEKKIERT